MKKLLAAMILPLLVIRAEPPVCTYENWDAEERTFAERLGALVAGDITPVDELTRQLKEGKKATLQFPTPAPGVPSLAPKEIFLKCRPGVVAFGRAYKCGKCDHWHISAASGFVLSADGVLVTNFHVMEKSEDTQVIGVRTLDGTVYPVKQVLASDKANDVALVKIDAENLTPLVLGEEPDVGDPVYVISHPVGAFYTFTDGMVSNKFLRRPRRGETAEFSITADFAKGSSGGPILNARGEVVGMVRATVSTYYEKDANLQMVWKYCIPSASLRGLTQAPVEKPAP